MFLEVGNGVLFAKVALCERLLTLCACPTLCPLCDASIFPVSTPEGAGRGRLTSSLTHPLEKKKWGGEKKYRKKKISSDCSWNSTRIELCV